MILWPLLSALLLLIDQVTKYIVKMSMMPGESIEVIPGIFSITYVHNTGAAFSFFSDHTWVLIVVSVILFLTLAFFWKRILGMSTPMKLGFFVALSGGLGNFIDRVRYGYVLDFLYLRYWPIFNVADMCIVCGVIVLFTAMLKEK